MYGKIFESIYTGTLYGQWEAIVTFQQMIVLADEDGTVDYTPPALAAKTSIPLEIIEKGIASLMEPDKYSRSPDEDGRRIVLLDEDRPWGWRLVNYEHYRNVASREEKKRKDRERVAEKRNKNKGVASCRNESHTVANVAHTDTDTDTEKIDAQFATFWEQYPRKKDKKRSERLWGKLTDKERDLALEDIKTRFIDADQNFIPYPSTYLNNKRWEDEKDGKPEGEWWRHNL